jgi:hypothetical protein
LCLLGLYLSDLDITKINSFLAAILNILFIPLVTLYCPITIQVNLCGHATLAAAHILFSSGLVDINVIEFVTLSGLLTVKKFPLIDVMTGAPNLQNGEAKDGFYIELDFPVDPIAEFNTNDTSLISEALNGASIIEIKRTEIADDILVSCNSLIFYLPYF